MADIDAKRNTLFSTIDPQKARELSRIFKVLSVDSRVSIIMLLKKHPMCVNALTAYLHISQGAVSQHLRVMRDCDLVRAEKKGYYVHYRLNSTTLARWEEIITSLLKSDTPGKPE